MKKIMLLFVVLFSVVLLTGCEKENLSFFGELDSKYSVEYRIGNLTDFDTEEEEVYHYRCDVDGSDVSCYSLVEVDAIIIDPDSMNLSIPLADLEFDLADRTTMETNYYKYFMPQVLVNKDDLTENLATFKYGVIVDFLQRMTDDEVEKADIATEMENGYVVYEFIFEESELMYYKLVIEGFEVIDANFIYE